MESWKRLTDAPISRVNHQAICLEDRIFVFGGFNSQMFDLDYNERQIDTFMWDIHKNRWEQLPYPLLLKSWDCNLKSWGPDPILESSGSIQPSLRFGHTVVAWRGRGWLFGGRMQQQVCPNQLYMFDPGSKFLLQSVSRPTLSGSLKLNHTINAKKFHPPCWAEVRGTVGSVPSARDGHSATVLEDAMFIFGGFEDVFDNYDNSVYRLDFITWNWTRIEIRDDLLSFSDLSLNIPLDTNRSRQVGINSHEYSNCTWDDSVSHNQTPHPRTPLPRDFACLTSHQGRIFLFGGRSKSPNHPSSDIYDSALWELIPLVSVSDCSSSDTANISEGQKLTPAKCSFCGVEMINYLGTTSGGLFRILWEEETGNWCGPEFWATSPPRPCCLWKFIHSNVENKSYTPQNYKLPSNYHSRWSSGYAVWIIRHPGHGLQSPEVLLSQIFSKVNGFTYDSKSSFVESSSSSSTSSKLNSPYGRRSLSHWSYNGNLYIAFGAIRSQTGRSLQLHYQDVWRFNLSTLSWIQLSYMPSMKSSNLHIHLPSARRRAVACLYVAPPSTPYRDYNPTLIRQHPRVFVFGGTQPRALNEKISLISNNGHNDSRSINESSTSYGMFPHRSLFNLNWGNNRTQNEVLGLRRNTSSLKSFVSILCVQSNSSTSDPDHGNIILSNSTTNSSLSTSATQSSSSSSPSNTPVTNFYLIIIIPSYLCNSHLLNGLSPLLINDFIRSETNQNYKPVILKQYTFYQNSHEIIHLQNPCCINHASDIYTSSQLINICLKSVIYALFEAVERGLKYTHSKYPNATTNSLSSTVYNPTMFLNDDDDDHGNQHYHNFLTYKTFFIYSDIDMEELENYATHVYIDVNQITSIVNTNTLEVICDDINTTNNNSFFSLSFTSKSIYNSNILSYPIKNSVQQTVASVLLKYLNFIQNSFHLIFEDNKLLLNQQEILQSLYTDPVHSFNENNSNIFSTPPIHFTIRGKYLSTVSVYNSSAGNSTSHISSRYSESSTSNNNNNSHVVSGSSHYFLSERLALEMLNNENIFNFTGIGMYSGGSSNDNFLTYNPPPATVEDEINDDNDDDDDVDHDGVGDDDYDNDDSDFSDIHCIPNIGVLSKGTEKLVELSDCYTFNFDTSLYELCLRSSSDLAQEPVISQILPSTIVNDLKHLYSPHIYSIRRSRFG
ncbi:kelch-like protein [Schistosoma mansoni]|uniref:kelch-like protein n=1 Tax=Schistosoma mansoni TaxID=6183 RepID=UPI0001A628AD|nr:kelch-like protein [Schistosoma mansoni]|eukprot:XP_018653012.1 kelch-like protein [Schistosoma mansoni]